MKRAALISAVVLSMAGSAFAESNTQQPATGMKPGTSAPGTATAQQPAQMDMSKMGPWTRKPTNEAATKKEIAEFFKKQDEAMQKGDFQASLASIDFPVTMVTDDAKGMIESQQYDQAKYTAMMKPFFENKPKDMKVTHKPTVTVLSDAMVSYVDNFTMTMGKQKLSGRSTALLVKKDGQWKWKVMSEPGWGGMSQGTGGSEPTPSTSTTPAPKKY